MKKGKTTVSVILCMAIIVSVLTIIPMNAPEAEAYVSLPGIEEIKHSSETFDILEIVPEAGSGSIGWYIAGQVPGVNWAQEKLASLSGGARAEAAAEYLGFLESAGLLGTSNTPLYKAGEYEEYAPWEAPNGVSGLKTLILNSEETYTVTGTFVEVEVGGEYRADNTYTVSEGGYGGNYDQNIKGLIHIDAPYPDGENYYYTVKTFSPLPAFSEVDDGQFIFRVVNFIDRDEDGHMDDPYDLIISIDDNTIIDSEKADIGSYSPDELIYLDFQGCKGSTYLTGLNLLAQYYTAAFTVSTEYNPEVPQFGVEANGFVRVEDGKGHFDAVTLGYTYVGRGASDAKYSFSSTGTNTYAVKTNTIYYTGGFTNNNWFLKYVFDWEDGELSPEIKVRSIVASSVTSRDVENADLIVLTRGFGTTAAYSFANDISADAARAIVDAKESKLPIIVDNSLRSRTDLEIGLLAAELTAGRTGSHFVSNNVYCISSPLATGAFNDAIDGDHKDTSSPFYPVWYEISYENFLRQNNDPNAITLPEKVSMATCIRYIINYGGQRIITKKTEIRVLELQPGSGESLTKEQVSGWTGIPTNKITIDTMSTSEFIGKIDDLVETYDLIYVGADLTGFKTKGSGSQLKTDYTDDLMDGLIYSNIGDKIAAEGLSQLTGLLDRDYNESKSGGYNKINYNSASWTFRFSGNDITQGKVSQLLDFAAAGYPIVVSDSLMSGTTGYDGFSFTAVVTENNGILMAAAREAEGTIIPQGITKTYQWFKKDPGGDILVSSSGTTFEPKESGIYYCKITINGQTAISNTAVTTSSAKPYTAEANEPSQALNGNYPKGDSKYIITISSSGRTYTVTVTPQPTIHDRVSYQWQSKNNQNRPWKDISGANNPSYSNNANHYFRCVVIINGLYCYSRWANRNNYEANNPVAEYPYTKFNVGVNVTPGDNAATLTAYWDPPSGYPNGSTTYITWYRVNPNGQDVSVGNSGSITATSGTYYCRGVVIYDGKEYDAYSNRYTITGGANDISITVNADYNPPAIVPAASSRLSVNTATVDYCSQMYKFLSGITSLPNAFTESGAASNSTRLTQYLNLSKPKIVFATDESGNPLHPPEYTGPYEGPSLSGRTLSFTFTIENDTDVTPAETRYYCNLYIDLNADGRYDYTEQLADIRIQDQNGNIVRTGELKAGVTYTVTRTLPDDYVGIIPWKLEVVKTTQSRVHASQHNYTHIKGTPKTIYVLQLLHNGKIRAGLNLKTDPTYQRLLGEVNSDFIVDITTLNVSELSGIEPGQVTRKNSSGENETIYYSNIDEYLNTFDMLILGFADAYRELDKTSADAVVRFINNPSGKSVLFTHDTTSIVNLPKNNYPTTNSFNTIDQPSDYYWGYYFNTVLRDAVGLDRYGVTNPEYGVTRYSPNKNNQNNPSGINVASGPINSQDKIDTLIEAGYSIAYAPKSLANADSSTPKSTVAEVQGFTNYTLRRYGERSGTYFDTDVVSQVNEGQITTYPFNLNLYGFGGNTNSSQKTMTVATTHEQYYQLNMNSDDIVVWYCLAGNNYKNLPNDVMNAYYIYSVGNVMYSGAGHSFGTVVESEAKLFINTMIAAYQSATTPPTVKIIDPSDPYGERELTDKFYVSDETGALASMTGHQEDSAIYFSIHDPSLGASKKITAKFYYGSDNKETKLPIYVKGGSANPINYNSSGNEINYTLSGGAIYYIYPGDDLLDAINEQNRVDFIIEITSSLLPNQPAEAVITLHKLGLFLLE